MIVSKFIYHQLFQVISSLFLLTLVGLFSSGCILDISGLSAAEGELAQIPEVTSVPTTERPSPTPIPAHTQASALGIATEIAENKAKATPTPEPTATAADIGLQSAPETAYPVTEDGKDYRLENSYLWYTSAGTADELQKFYIDRMTYLRWDDYEIGDAGEGYSDIQFEKNYEQVQVSVWENAGLEHSSIVIFEVEPMLEMMRQLPATAYSDKWIIMEPPKEEDPESEIPTEYLAEYPLPIVRIFYILRMLDAGWQLIPTERLDTYAMDLQFFKESGERLVILLQDNGVGTTVTLVE